MEKIIAPTANFLPGARSVSGMVQGLDPTLLLHLDFRRGIAGCKLKGKGDVSFTGTENSDPEKGTEISTNDNLNIQTSGNIDVNQGTIEIALTPNWDYDDSVTHYIFDCDDGYNTAFRLLKVNTNVFYFRYGNQSAIDAAPIYLQDGVEEKFRITWESSGSIYLYRWESGSWVQKATAVVGDAAQLYTTLYLGSINGNSGFLNGWIKYIKIWNQVK